MANKPVKANEKQAPAAKSRVNPAAKPAVAKLANKTKPKKEVKPKKDKLVRDSFTMPEGEYELFAQVKKRCLVKGAMVKKSEILRAAIASFAALSDTAITKAVQKLAVIKTGRKPKTQK